MHLKYSGNWLVEPGLLDKEPSLEMMVGTKIYYPSYLQMIAMINP